MASARPDRPTWFEGGASEEEEEDDDNNVEDDGKPKDESLQTSINKQNGTPPARNVDRYGFMGGDQYTSPEEISKVTLDVIRKREVKWVEMFENWEKWMTKRFKRVRERCRKGIPPSLRARAWQYLCGSKFLMDQNQGKFEEYLHKDGDPRWIDDIHKDLHRQFPLHEIFALRGGHGQEDLFRILKAYTIHNPQDGYCQAQGPIAAVLLMHMPAEQAFWCLVSICEKYLPGYYSPGLEAVHIDGDVLFGLLKKSSPLIYKHLKKQKIEPILYMTEWFMCVFSRTLPWTAVLRVWDMFFCEGVKVMFRIALVLFKLTLGTPGKLAECPTLYETMEKLRHIPHELIEGEFIANESLKLNVDEKDMEKEHQNQITKRRNLREKAQSSAKTDTRGSKKKKKEKQLENEQKEKKHDGYSYLTFRKLHSKLLSKEPRKENVSMTAVSKPLEDEPIVLPSNPVSNNESVSPKKSQTNKMQEMAKILAEEAFTAKMQQTVQPDVQSSVEVVESVGSVTAGGSSSSEATLQQESQTYSSDMQLPLSVVNERLSSEAKVSLDMQAVTERPLSESSVSFRDNQLEEAKMHSTDGNQQPEQQQQPVPSCSEEAKHQLHFVDADTATAVHHKKRKGENEGKIHQINLAAKLEPGQLLTYPTSQIQSQISSSSQPPIQKTENEHSYSDNPLNSDFITSEATPPAEMQISGLFQSRSQSPTPSRNLIWKSVNDPICLDKTLTLNHTTTGPIESQVPEGLSSSGELAELFVNPLSIEPDAVEWQQIQESEISNDTNLQQVLETVEMLPKQQLLVEEQPMPTKQQQQPDGAAFNPVNVHIVLEPKISIADNEIETPRLELPNQKLTAEPVIVKSQQVLRHKNIKPKHTLAASQQIQSSRPLSTEIVKVKPQKLSSTLEMEVSSISPESTNTIVLNKQSVPPSNELAVEYVLVKTERPLKRAESMSERLKQLSLSAEPSPLNLVSPKENPKSGEKPPLCPPDPIEHPSVTLQEDPKATTDNLIQESVEIEQTGVSEQLVQQLSWQTVQDSNEDGTSIPVEEVDLPPKYDFIQMEETHV